MGLRQFCLLCGRMPKQALAGSHVSNSAFYSIHSEFVSTADSGGGDGEGSCEGSGRVTIAHKLKEILRVNLPKKKLVPSEEICKKCFRQISEIDYLENQVISLLQAVDIPNVLHTSTTDRDGFRNCSPTNWHFQN